jgi:hypothetical protein
MSLEPHATARRPGREQTLAALFCAGVVALTLVQAPNELFYRFAFGDSGTSLTIDNLVRRGFRPGIDFGYIYGLLPLLINRGWFAIVGATPRACWWSTLLCNMAMAWGLARFATAQRVGWVGLTLLAVGLPDLLRSSYDVLVQALEPALLVHALAEQAYGRRDRALAFATAAAFVKPSMAYIFGLQLLVTILFTIERRDRHAWLHALGPALVTGASLVLLLSAVYGFEPLVRTLIPTAGIEVYRQSGFGFFHGTGRDFWYRPGAGLRGYLRYEIGYWILGTFVLIGGGIESLVWLARRRTPKLAYNDEVVLTCALLHVIFVTSFFGHRFSWKYYHALFLLGLAGLVPRGGRHALVVAVLAAMVLFTDKAWVQSVAHDWRARAPSKTTLGLWTTPEDQREWARVLDLTRGQRPALLAECEGAALLFPQFAPPTGAYFVPGHPVPAEVRRKASQLASAGLIVKVGPPGDRRFERWPELISALDGCEPIWEGNHYQVYRRVRPPWPPLSLKIQASRNGVPGPPAATREVRPRRERGRSAPPGSAGGSGRRGRARRQPPRSGRASARPRGARS